MTGPPHSVWTIIVAAGSGSRFEQSTPKQFLEIGGRRVLDWSAAHAAEVSDGIVVVMPPDGVYATARLPDVAPTELRVASGGSTRSNSVRNGLALVPEVATIIVVHDAARPLASSGLFATVIEAVRSGADAAIPTVPVIDTMRHVEGMAVDRAKLRAVQTPQGFEANILRRAHREHGDSHATDDATLVERAGGSVTLVAGERWNVKLTEPGDEVVVAALLPEGP